MIDIVCRLMCGSSKKAVRGTNFLQYILHPKKIDRIVPLNLLLSFVMKLCFECRLNVCVMLFLLLPSQSWKKSTQFQNIGLFIQPFFLFSLICLYNLSLIFSVRIAMLFIENGVMHALFSPLVFFCIPFWQRNNIVNIQHLFRYLLSFCTWMRKKELFRSAQKFTFKKIYQMIWQLICHHHHHQMKWHQNMSMEPKTTSIFFVLCNPIVSTINISNKPKSYSIIFNSLNVIEMCTSDGKSRDLFRNKLEMHKFHNPSKKKLTMFKFSLKKDKI